MPVGPEIVTARARAGVRARFRHLSAHPVGGPALALVCTLLGFLGAARFSYQLVDAKSGLLGLWLPNGVAVALFVLAPRHLRRWVLLGVLPGELIADTLQGYPLLVTFGFGLTDMFESALAGVILLRIAGRRPRGDTQRDFYAILIAASTAPIVGGVFGAAITAMQWHTEFESPFLLWWLGDLTGIFLVASLAIALANPLRPVARSRWISAAIAVALVAASTAAVFGLARQPIMFLVLFPVVGVALRHNLRVTSFATLAFAIVATLLTTSGHGPFVPFDSGPVRAMLAQGFIALTAAIAFLISATMASQRRAEHELEDSLALAEAASLRVRASFDGAAIGMLLVGAEGVLLAANRSGAAMFRCDPTDLVGTNGIDLIHPDDQALLMSRRQQLTAATGYTVLELRGVRKDGTEMIGRYTTSPILAAGGALLHRLVEIEDVTELRRVELELATSRAQEAERDEQLRQAQRLESVGRLAGGVAHDFNNLLVGIRGYSELALQKVGVGPGATELRGAIAAADDAAALTAQLLAHSRLQVLDPQVFDLRDAVTEMADLLRRMIGGTVELTTELPAEQVLVKADRPQIGQVIMNLAVNASDAMPAGGRLSIAIMRDGATQRAIMTVRDEGVGMNADTVAQIYEPFFSTKGDLGTGLGLSTVHGIVAQSGGQIDVASSPGEGTTFTITLPLTSEERSYEAPLPKPNLAGSGGEQILFVDDEPTVRDVVSRMLSHRGYHVSVVGSGEEAVAHSRATAPGTIDIVVTDLGLSGLNGRETADAIRAHQPAAKTLYISGYTDDEAVRLGGYGPGVGFLQKPFSSDELDAKIRTLLDAIVL